MSTTLILPSGAAPSNLHLKPGIRATGFVEGDVYDIALRVGALGRTYDTVLHVIQMEDGADCKYAVMEHCKDGMERLVFKFDDLDGRVLEKLRRLMSIPFRERFAKLEAEEILNESKRKDDELEKLYEEVGRPMWTQLEHDGFIESRGVSYPKAGVAAPGRAR